jgi:hypothetical protein
MHGGRARSQQCCPASWRVFVAGAVSGIVALRQIVNVHALDF